MSAEAGVDDAIRERPSSEQRTRWVTGILLRPVWYTDPGEAGNADPAFLAIWPHCTIIEATAQCVGRPGIPAAAPATRACASSPTTARAASPATRTAARRTATA